MSSRFKQFVSDRRGNFALFSAILAVPLILGAGVALDVANVSRTKSELQNAIDAAVLAIAREGKQVTDKQALEIANSFLKNNYGLQFAELKLVREGSTVKLDASAQADMAFGGLFGYDDWKVATSSTADIAYMSYEIALVLDTTGSMAGGKLAAMKDAVDNMIVSMSAQVADKDKLKFALVPFATFVNVGPQFGPSFDAKGKIKKGTGAAWLDLQSETDAPQSELEPGVSRFEIFNNLGEPWKGCVETRFPGKTGAHDVADTPPDAKDKRSLFSPALAIDEPDTPEYENSYIVSSADPTAKGLLNKLKLIGKYGLQIDIGFFNLSSLLAGLGLWTPPATTINAGHGPNRGCDVQPITALTANYGDLRTKVSQLQASGTTNIMEGVAWGARVLSPGEPFGQGAKPRKSLQKVMVVLTDGSNVMGNRQTKLKSSYSSFGYLVDGRLGVAEGSSGDTNALMNAKTLEACTSAKQAGTVIYTIRLEEPDVKTGTMLRDCATDPDHYFDIPSRSQLDDAFKAIKERIVLLRLAS
ncbi:MAG: TadE/TadG family protein [Rhizobiales bacterium]|nr:TadE/TadG family protein [Hyphomicrobiales bacterium]